MLVKMFKMSLKHIYYTFYSYALHVSAAQGHLQATHSFKVYFTVPLTSNIG
jgi:hypothetical protein